MIVKFFINVLCLLSVLFFFPSTICFSADQKDIDMLTSYAVMLGRAAACKADTKEAVSRIGAWMDRSFPPGSSDQQIFFPIFAEGVKMNFEKQLKGESPDSCNDVIKNFNKMNWPEY
ncbi:hypothetical protein [Desulfobulbus propionicus]|jgi:hypothetical protein